MPARASLRFQILSRAKRRTYSTATTPSPTSPFSPRHFLSCADLSSKELTALVRRAHTLKQSIKSGSIPASIQGVLTGQNIAIIFNKRSTRTRVSTEGAVARLGGCSMYLGKDDIQLGVNESLRDSSIVISSMVSAMIARVAAHQDVVDLAQYSSVPVINALSDAFHPCQAIADTLTLYETFGSDRLQEQPSTTDLGLTGLKIAWVGDANNVLYDLAIAAGKLGIQVSIATPKGYAVPEDMRAFINSSTKSSLVTMTEPSEAVNDADVLVTDTWISMGQEDEKQKRLKAFRGFEVTSDLAQKGGAKANWKFMHCLPRHPEEVSDEIFYHPERSLVFTEAENRLWSMIAILEAFVVNKGRIT